MHEGTHSQNSFNTSIIFFQFLFLFPPVTPLEKNKKSKVTDMAEKVGRGMENATHIYTQTPIHSPKTGESQAKQEERQPGQHAKRHTYIHTNPNTSLLEQGTRRAAVA